MSVSSRAELATRSGALQPATQGVTPKTTRTRESESTYGSSFGEESDWSGDIPSFSTPEKRVSRQKTRRQRGTEEGRDARGRDEAPQVQTTSKAQPKPKTRSQGQSVYTPDRGLVRAQQLLKQQALLNQASIRFEAQRGPSTGPTSAYGQQRAMLDQLVEMTKMLYHQHTGDKAGEIYTRPAARQILTALQGLQLGHSGSSAEGATVVEAPRRSKREFMAQFKEIERVQIGLNPPVLPVDYEPLDLVA